MTPAEVAALLRIKQAREQRMRAALEGARRAEREAGETKLQAQQAGEAFSEQARQSRAEAYSRLEEAGNVGVWPLQACAADLAALRAHEHKLAGQVRRAAAAETDSRAQAEQAARRHSAAQRGAEAFDVLRKEVRAAADAAAELAEEAETEEPRRGPPHAR